MQTRGFYSDIKPHLSFNQTIGNDLNSEDTIKLIIKTINQQANSPTVKSWIKILQQGNPTKLEFLKRVFGVACKNVEYVRDPNGHEIIFTPVLLMKVGRGDCKKFTVFIGSILKAANIDFAVKVVSYDGSNWAHVYIIVPIGGDRYITLDPVNHCRYDNEVAHAKARLNYLDYSKSKIIMGHKLSLMGGLGNLPSNLIDGINEAATKIDDDLNAIAGIEPQTAIGYNGNELAGLGNEYINGLDDVFLSGDDDLSGDDEILAAEPELGLGARKRSTAKKQAKAQRKARRQAEKPAKKAKRKALRKKIFKGAAKVNFLPIRAAFLSLIKMAGALQKTKLKINLAKRLKEAYDTKPEAAANLNKIWEKFGGEVKQLKKAIDQAAKSKLHGMGELNNLYDGIGVAPAVAAAAVITAATPILIPVIKMLGKKKAISPEAAEVVEAGAEAAEEVATTVSREGGFSPETVRTLTKSKLIKEAIEDDDGGSPAMQVAIKKDAQRFDEPIPTGEEIEQGVEVEDFKKGTTKKAGSSADLELANDKSNLPVKADHYAPKQANVLAGIYTPRGWLMIILTVGAACQHFKINQHNTNILTSICGVFLIGTFIYQSIKFFTNKNQ